MNIQFFVSIALNMKRIKLSPLMLGVYAVSFFVFGFKRFGLYLLAILVHETGHLAAIVFFKQKIDCIVVGVGGFDIKRRGGSSYYADAVIAILGPLFGVLFAFVGYWLGFFEFFIFSLAYSILNLLPIFPLDGGCFLSAFLNCFFRVERVDFLVNFVSWLFIFPVYVISVLLLLYTGWNLTLLLLCISIFFQTISREKT